ncbi:YhbY family RNA-binding protein [Schleiferilactobacillus shenzhenensis]|nr:YhbY family RNA-binding protein [Schleiferilactobacillus shenzhenensis]
MALTGKQKSYLRSQGQTMKPLFRVGKNAVTPEFITQVDDALAKRELIKISLLPAAEVSLDEALSVLTNALPSIAVVQTIGKTALLYRPAEKEKNQHFSTAVKALIRS